MDKVKQKIDKELEQIQFSSKQQVLQKVKKKSLFERGRHLLNKEVEIPLLPFTGITIALITVISLYPMMETNQQTPMPDRQAPRQDKIIEKGGSFYWESWFNEVKKYES
ncbi:hypothetical protein [Aquibacillus sediminis]|uniref:hypothetical protein n=1 Tax=Aquibacillus sediminis TaxID=2574734 RepID=UPI0011089D0B|nr:hypothetical protein [Aquibacillus sediminis]